MKNEEQIRREISRDIELMTVARCHASGYGPQSDVCEDIWMILAEFGIHSDGHTPIHTYIRRILDRNRLLELTAPLAEN